MPIFEYVCQKCRHRFEKIVYGADAALSCPSCQSDKLEKQLSVFTASGRGREFSPGEATGPGACGSCGDPRGPGSCSLN